MFKNIILFFGILGVLVFSSRVMAEGDIIEKGKDKRINVIETDIDSLKEIINTLNSRIVNIENARLAISEEKNEIDKEPDYSQLFDEVSGLSLWDIIIFSFVLILFIYLLTKMLNSQNRINSIITKINSHFANAPSPTRLSIPQSHELEDLRNRIEDMERRIPTDVRVNDNNRFEVLNNKTFSDEKVETNFATDDLVEPKVLFGKIPDRAGHFNKETLSAIQDIEHVYELSISGNKAKLSIVNDENAHYKAIKNPGIFLETACEYQNSPTTNSSFIKVIKWGLAEKFEDKWKIITKIKIKFE